MSESLPYQAYKEHYSKPPQSPPLPVIVLDPSPPVSNASPSPPASPPLPKIPDQSTDLSPEPPRANGVHPNGSGVVNGDTASGSATTTSPTTTPTSTFRRVVRNSRAPLPSSPLAGGHSRTLSTSSTASRNPRQRIQSLSASTNENPSAASYFPQDTGNRRHSTPLNGDAVAASLASVVPPVRTSSLAGSPAVSRTPRLRQYRPGFQPKGVYRPRTDEHTPVSAGYASAERTKLERRLEKLVALHFPEEGKSTTGVGRRPGLAQANANRRASSFFDLDFKSILGGGGGKEDIRCMVFPIQSIPAEQRITPWQEDASVNKCPLCMSIICALPIKRPQRPQLCSVLFVVDPKTRNIEEVGEGVDYGVRKRRTSNASGVKPPQEEAAEEEKFLRGVRICSQCRPVLLRQQYHQQGMRVPTFVKLYEAFVILEKEIEDSLPQFQELILTLNHDSQPTKEASAARKRLLDAFAQYDALAKRIHGLPTPNGRGSSQERVQAAVMTRASIFLQKNMFPLQVHSLFLANNMPSDAAVTQSLPTAKRAATTANTPVPVGDDDTESIIDPPSATALALQPLLEQEALLETFVEEAKAQRKFEDAKTLRVNLGEIREEIERVMKAEGLKGKRTRKGR
ncbi:hypothetical protein C8R46DRAFT_1159749 [Mycena filopes]|nr:hypothetical protein C8R46DRAFT_1159749 [Mycena filopes]